MVNLLFYSGGSTAAGGATTTAGAATAAPSAPRYIYQVIQWLL